MLRQSSAQRRQRQLSKAATEATEPAWDLMKLLPSTLGDPSSVDNPGEPPLDAALWTERHVAPFFLSGSCCAAGAALSLQVLLSMHKPAAMGYLTMFPYE